MYHDTKVPFAYVAKKTGDDLKKTPKCYKNTVQI